MLVSPFGERDWNDVRRVVFRRLQRRFPGAGPEDIEDAVGSALVDLCDYWLHAARSIGENTDRNFWFAVQRATWMGLAFLGQETTLLDRQSSLDGLMEMDREPRTAEGPEDEYIEGEMRDVALGLVAELDDERAGWLKGFLEGATCRDEATAEDVSPMTISRRRVAALDDLQRLATEAGLR